MPEQDKFTVYLSAREGALFRAKLLAEGRSITPTVRLWVQEYIAGNGASERSEARNQNTNREEATP